MISYFTNFRGGRGTQAGRGDPRVPPPLNETLSTISNLVILGQFKSRLLQYHVQNKNEGFKPKFPNLFKIMKYGNSVSFTILCLIT